MYNDLYDILLGKERVLYLCSVMTLKVGVEDVKKNGREDCTYKTLLHSYALVKRGSSGN